MAYDEHALHRPPWAMPSDLEVAIDKVLDNATIQLLRLTSSPMAKMLAAHEVRMGVPVYDHPTDTDGTDVRPKIVVQCAAPKCYKRFVLCYKGHSKRYCSARCRVNAHYARHHGDGRAVA